MSDAARQAVLPEHLKTLKLPAITREYPVRARQARDAGWDYGGFLRELLEAEVLSRRERAAAARLKAAQFPDHKTLEQIDWQAMQGIGRPKIAELARCGELDRAEDVVFAGPIGTGKTHLAMALGIEPTQRRHRVLFRRAADLVRELVEARDERDLVRLQVRLRRVDLLIVDEVGFVPFDRAGGELLFQVLADRYERRSIMVTTNLAFSEWVQVFGDEKLTTVLLDRLSHQAHIITTKGRSYRTRGRRKGKPG